MAKVNNSKDSTEKQKIFAYAYFNNNGNGTRAAIEAGYSSKTAAQAASRLLKKVKVIEILKRLNGKVEEKAVITKTRIAEELVKIGLFDLRTIYDENGALKPIGNLSDEAGAAITGIKVMEEFAGSGEDRIHIGNTVEIKLNGKIAALDSLKKLYGYDQPTKVAATDPDGNAVKPFTPQDVEDIITALKKKNT